MYREYLRLLHLQTRVKSVVQEDTSTLPSVVIVEEVMAVRWIDLYPMG